MAQANKIFSGEQLPVAPLTQDAELSNFHRKMLDYLRRLGAKLDQFIALPGDGVAIPTASCYLSGDQPLELALTAITWSDAVWVDTNAFTHSSEYIQVVESGLYMIVVDVEVADAGLTDIVAEIQISAPGGSSTFAPAFGHARLGVTSLSMTVILPLLALRRIAIFVSSPSGADATGIKAEGSRFHVLRLRSNITNSGGDGWIDDDFDGIPDGWGGSVIS